MVFHENYESRTKSLSNLLLIKLTDETWQDSCVTLNGNGSAIFTGIARKAPGWESDGKDCLRLRYKDLLDSRKRQKTADDEKDLRILYQVSYNPSMPSNKSDFCTSLNLAQF